MILLVPNENDNIATVATQMVNLSIARQDSVNAVFHGIPLVTYPNDMRNREERISLLMATFASNWLPPEVMAMPPNEVYDSRFDPKFTCDFCSLSSSRERALKALLRSIIVLLKKRFPADQEIGAMVMTIDAVIQSADFQQQIADNLAKRT